jgi:hypothetical protein
MSLAESILPFLQTGSAPDLPQHPVLPKPGQPSPTGQTFELITGSPGISGIAIVGFAIVGFAIASFGLVA